MFQLYKKRDFSAYIGDTIAFIRIYWKNFFGNYIVITGGLLAILCIFYFFIFRDLFSALTNLENRGIGYDLSYYFSDNAGIFIAMVGIALIIGIVFSILSLIYPIAYMRLVEDTGKEQFSTAEIFEKMKRYLPRTIVFSLYSFITFVPLLLLGTILSIVLMVVIVGIFLLILLLPAVSLWFVQSLFLYLHEEMDFFNAMKQAWKILFSKKFWHMLGSTIVIYVALNIVQSMLSSVPYFIFLFGFIINQNSAVNSNYPIVLSGLYIVTIVVSYILSNILMINQGIIFYSFLEQKNHAQALSEIDYIGQNAE